MPSAREMRLRIRSVKNIAQVTRALETVSASKVKKAIQAMNSTRPYSEKAWKVLVHLARQPGHESLHPLLQERDAVRKVLVVLISGDRGLAGAYNINIVRKTLDTFAKANHPVAYITVGRKGRDLLLRRRQEIIAEFSNLPVKPSFMDVSAIGRLVIEEYLSGRVDQVFLAYTEFKNMVIQVPLVRKLLPLEVAPAREEDAPDDRAPTATKSVFIYEPDQAEILDQVVERFTAVQVYQAVLTSSASEHAARMVAMRNATDNANDLASLLVLEYNKIRQQSITNDMLDIAGGAEALTKVLAEQQ
jgi:F-type H+-transporting ATPase subunit gamma